MQKIVAQMKRKRRIVTEDISRGLEVTPIRVVNDIDDTDPFHFDYVISYVPRDVTFFNIASSLKRSSGFSNVSNTKQDLVSCNCTDTCSKSCPCVRWVSQESGSTIVKQECSLFCSCSFAKCRNRKYEKRENSKKRFEIFKTKGKGWGVRCLDFIKKGEFVGEYIGEILTNKHCTDYRNIETAYLLTCFVENKVDYSYLHKKQNNQHVYIKPFLKAKDTSKFSEITILNPINYSSLYNLSNTKRPSTLKNVKCQISKSLACDSYDLITNTKDLPTMKIIHHKLEEKRKLIKKNARLLNLECDVEEEIKKCKIDLEKKMNKKRKRYAERAEKSNKSFLAHIPVSTFNAITERIRIQRQDLKKQKENEEKKESFGKLKEILYKLKTKNRDQCVHMRKVCHELSRTLSSGTNRDRGSNKLLNFEKQEYEVDFERFKFEKPQVSRYNDDIDIAAPVERPIKKVRNDDWLIIDAMKKANFTRFFNTSCEPNLDQVLVDRHEFISAYLNGKCKTVRFKRLMFVASSDIEPYTELTWHYGEYRTDITCKCGSMSCANYSSSNFK